MFFGSFPTFTLLLYNIANPKKYLYEKSVTSQFHLVYRQLDSTPTYYQRCATLNIRRWILVHFQLRINVISTLSTTSKQR